MEGKRVRGRGEERGRRKRREGEREGWIKRVTDRGE